MIGIPAILLTLIPPIPLEIHPPSGYTLLLLVLVVFYLAYFTWTLKLNFYVQLFTSYIVINVIASKIPFVSQMALISLIFCIYLFYFCVKSKGWELFIKMLKVSFFLQVTFVVLQAFKIDNLLNCNLPNITCNGIQGNSMQICTLLCVMGLFLFEQSLVYLVVVALVAVYFKSAGALVGIMVWLSFRYKKLMIPIIIFILAMAILWSKNAFYFNIFYSRLPVWGKTIGLCLKHPFLGWGLGSFKVLFPVLAHGTFQAEGIWYNCHNEFLQLWFELGLIGCGIIAIWLCQLFSNKEKSGIMMLLALMLVHFPLRMTSTVLIITMYLAYCERKGMEIA